MTANGKAQPHSMQGTWRLEQRPDGWSLVLDGAVDARFEYGEILYTGVAGPGRIGVDLGGVTRIDCQGVSRLLWLVEALADRQLIVVYQRCSPAMVTRINQVPLLLRHAAVESVFAPYCCEQTGEESLRLLDVTALDDPQAPPIFEDDRGTWALDELPGRFFAFLQRRRWADPPLRDVGRGAEHA